MESVEHGNSYCEIWDDGRWQQVEVAAIIGDKKIIKRCWECHGAIRVHKAGRNNSTRAHAEHQKRFKGCSLGDCFDGERRMNPDPVKTPT